MRTNTQQTIAAILALAMAFTFNACGKHYGEDEVVNDNSSSSGGDTNNSSSSGTETGGGSSSSSGTETGGGSSSSSGTGIGGSSSSVNVFVGNKGTFSDSRDGTAYKWVKIGEQIWMAENLNHVTPGSICYDNLDTNCDKYGRLYTWNRATFINASNKNPSDVQGVCPDGWHLPSNGEWTTLTNYLGNNQGRKLKATSGWNDYNGGSGNGTDDYGFEGLPGGYAGSDGAFSDIGTNTYWWSTTFDYGSGSNAHYYRMTIGTNHATNLGSFTYNYYFSVRCILGEQIRPVIKYGSLVDRRDNNTYKTVKIGTQTWMAENLNYKATNSKCYGNLAENCDKYGRLYTWTMAVNGAASSAANPSGVQGVCPDGWHIPSNGEWTTLTNYAGDNAGRKLKAAREWSYNGTDYYGFGALPGGYAGSDGAFVDIGTNTYWWSTTFDYGSGSNAHYYRLGLGYDHGTSLGSFTYNYYFSVRCVENIELP